MGEIDSFHTYAVTHSLFTACAFRRARSAKTTTTAGRKIRLIDSRIIDVLPVRRVFSNVSSVSTSYVEIETPYRFLTGSAAIQRFEFYFGFVFKQHGPRPAITFQFLIPAPTRSLGDRVVLLPKSERLADRKSDFSWKRVVIFRVVVLKSNFAVPEQNNRFVRAFIRIYTVCKSFFFSNSTLQLRVGHVICFTINPVGTLYNMYIMF